MTPAGVAAMALAGLVSAPALLLAILAGIYVAYSLVADTWYRDLFGGYGFRLFVLYAVYTLGVAAAALLAARPWAPRGARVRLALVLGLAAGMVSAALLEWEFREESDRLLPRGTFVVPFIAWLAAGAFIARTRRVERGEPPADAGEAP